MIDWVDAVCKDWGRCTRWIMTSTDEGYPSMDAIAKAREGHLSAGERSTLSQRFGEVRTGNALDIQRALRMQPYAPEVLQAVLWAQYALRAPSKVRAEAWARYLKTEFSMTDYWRTIDRLHWFLIGRLNCSTVEPRVAIVETRMAL